MTPYPVKKMNTGTPAQPRNAINSAIVLLWPRLLRKSQVFSVEKDISLHRDNPNWGLVRKLWSIIDVIPRPRRIMEFSLVNMSIHRLFSGFDILNKAFCLHIDKCPN